MTCSRCGKPHGGFFSALTADLGKPFVCPECEAKARLRAHDLARLIEKILLTTTPTIEGHRIAAYLGIESVEIVIGTGLFSELTGDISDFFG
jgi:hypothetical protein